MHRAELTYYEIMDEDFTAIDIKFFQNDTQIDHLANYNADDYVVEDGESEKIYANQTTKITFKSDTEMQIFYNIFERSNDFRIITEEAEEETDEQ